MTTSMNVKLFKVASPEIFIEMGFVEENDGTGDPRGVDWNLRTSNFHLLIDPWCEVKLCRINPETDYIILQVEDLYELQSVIDWIAD